MESTRAMPSRFRNAPEAASEPASEAVCETVACLRLFGAADLHGDDRLLQFARACRQPLEAGYRIEAFDMQAERGDALVLDQAERHFGQAGLCLVAGGHQEGDRQAALLHRHVDGDVGRLGDDGDAAGRPRAA